MKYPQLQQMYELEDSYWWFVARRRLVRNLITKYVPGSDLKMLDAGVGTGGLINRLEYLGEVWGCDISPQALEFCRQRGQQRLVHCSVTDLQFPADSFDVVTSCDVIEHIQDDQQALREMHRVLRPGGVLIITVPALQFLWSPHDEVLHHLRRYNKDQLRGILAAAGFEELKLSYVVCFLMPLMVIHRWWMRITGRGVPRIGITPVPRVVDSLFRGVQRLESLFVDSIGLPWGASLVAIVRKPAQG